MRDPMRRRDFLTLSALSAGALVTARGALAAGPDDFLSYTKVDPSLFQGINRAKDPDNETGLEKLHVPVVEVPDKVKAGEPFAVRIAVGRILHPMLPNHYIHFAELYAGNETAGRALFYPVLNVPEATLTLKLDRPVTLVVRQYCNLHGLWESRRAIQVG